MYHNPGAYDLERVSIPVSGDLIRELRAEIPVSREECLRWVDNQFDEMATHTYKSIGSPSLVAKEGWNIFSQMAYLLEPNYRI